MLLDTIRNVLRALDLENQENVERVLNNLNEISKLYDLFYIIERNGWKPDGVSFTFGPAGCEPSSYGFSYGSCKSPIKRILENIDHLKEIHNSEEILKEISQAKEHPKEIYRGKNVDRILDEIISRVKNTQPGVERKLVRGVKYPQPTSY